MKDSNAAPSPKPSAKPSARGKTNAPKARANAVSKAKKAKPQKTVAAVVSPETKIVSAKSPEGATSKVVAAQAVATSPEPVAPTVIAPQKASSEQVVAPKTAPPGEVVAARAPTTPSATPEILFPEALAPKIAPSQTKTPAPKVTASNVVVNKAVAPKVVAPKAAVTKTALANASTATATNSNALKTTAPNSNAPKTTGNPPLAASKRKLPKMSPLYIGATVVAITLTTAGGVAVGSYNQWSNGQQIAPNVQIAGESVGGLTREEAIARLSKRFGKLAVTLETEDKNVVLGLADMGGKPSIEPTVEKAFAIGRSDSIVNNFSRVFGSEMKSRSFMLPIEWNRGALTSRLAIVNGQYARPAVDARLVAVSQGTPRVTGEETGRALDVTATADAIQKSYFPGVSKIKATVRAVEPKVTAADLAGRDVKLGEYRTTYNSGIAGRTTNIHVACRAVDGQVFMPGEVLSFNGLTGERTYSKGYRMAHIFMRERGQSESQIVDGLAGGVCQVSSTLYNAVRKANAQSVGTPLSIVERSSHSLPVTYVPSGRDATVAWPSKDFKFRNDNTFPIYVRTNAQNGRLTISIWGRVPQDQAVPVSLQQ